MSFCGKCGNKLNEGAKFCPKCGKKTTNANLNSTVPELPQNQNIIAPPLPEYKHQYPAQQYQQVAPPVKPKSKKVLLISMLSVIFIVFIVGLFFTYKIFFSGPQKMTAEYKIPDENKIIQLDSGGLAPANLFGIMLKDEYDMSDAEDIAKLIKGKVVGEIELCNVYQIEYDGKTKEDLYSAIEKVNKSEKIFSAFPDAALSYDGKGDLSCNPFDDPSYDKEDRKPYEMINLKQAWDIIKASGVKLNGVKVGVVDEAINYNSDEINKGKVKITPLANSDKSAKNVLTHGTMVTEVIAANNENGGIFGVASILGDNLQVNTTVSGKITLSPSKNKNTSSNDISEMDAKEIGYKSEIFTIEAMRNIQKQIDNGATIINCSFSNHLKDYDSKTNKDLSKVFKNLLEKTQKKYPNVIIVGTAGNDKGILNKNKIWGHKLDNLITVGALDRNRKRASYSNITTKALDGEITVVACGDIKMENGKVVEGTSFAAPQVTGLISILRSIDPKLSPSEVKNILVSTANSKADNDPDNELLVQNLIQADDAVLKVIEKVTGKKFDKMKLLAMCEIELNAQNNSSKTTVTSTIKEVGEKGTDLEIEFQENDVKLTGDKVKKLKGPGSVNWELISNKPGAKLEIKVTRLDTKSCKTIVVSSEKSIIGEYTAEYSLQANSDNYSGKKIDAHVNNKVTFNISSDNKLQININDNINDGTKNFPIKITINANLENRENSKGNNPLFKITGNMHVTTSIFDYFAKKKPTGPVLLDGYVYKDKITMQSKWMVTGGQFNMNPNDENSGIVSGAIDFTLSAKR